MTQEDAILEVSRALDKARNKHAPIRVPHEGYAVILEELDELWEEIKKQPIDIAAMKKEALHVAAMGLRFLIDICPGDYIEEREAGVCPEDVGFEEYIRALRAKLETAEVEIARHNRHMGTIPSLDHRPTNIAEGIRFLARWFDAMYPDDSDTQIQDDLRKWAEESDSALARERELSLACERMRGVLIEINRNLGLIMTAENRGFGIAYIEGLSESICGNIDEELSNPRCGEKHNEEMHEHEYDEPYKNYLFWCSEGCGFVDQHHRCEQWSSLTYIPPELAEALRQIRAKL